MLYIEHCLSILPLFVAICEISLPGLTYGVYLVLFLKPGPTHNKKDHSHKKFQKVEFLLSLEDLDSGVLMVRD